jgi:bifunctional non-homologous end joining protein LigD
MSASVVDQLTRLERDGGGGELRLDGGELPVTHLDRVVFPRAGATKGALMRYYARVAPALLPLLADRPLALRRFPAGVEGPSFFQHEPRDWPAVVRVAKVRLEDGTVRPRLVGGDLATLLYTVQMGAVSAHPWLSRVGSLATPDAVVIDLDPGDDADFDRVVEVARAVREALDARGLVGAPKTSGATGLHVVVAPPRKLTWKASAALAEAVAREVHAALPRRTTLARSPAKRPPGTVYLDHLQNARGKTVASAWSVRATPGATVSTPLDWAEVAPGLRPAAFTMETALARLQG